MKLKCSRCRNHADYIDCFHPWQDEYTLCKTCLPIVTAENMNRPVQDFEQGKVILHPPSWKQKCIWRLQELAVVIVFGGIILHLVKELL